MLTANSIMRRLGLPVLAIVLFAGAYGCNPGSGNGSACIAEGLTCSNGVACCDGLACSTAGLCETACVAAGNACSAEHPCCGPFVCSNAICREDSGSSGLEPSPDALPDFALADVNTNSLRYEQTISPRDYLGKISAWYFGHST